MVIIRRVIFAIFLVSYLIICPLLVFYSLGYIINPLKKEVSHTGLVYLSTTPAGADIFLENSRYDYRTPTSITELLPASYNIRIRLKGYKVWSHHVSVEAGKALAFDNIIMIPRNWRAIKLSGESYKDIMPIPGTNYFILAKSSELGGYYIYDCLNNETRPLFVDEASLFDLNVSNAYTQASRDMVVIAAGNIFDRRYFLAKIGAKYNTVFDITKLIQEKPSYVFYGNRQDHELFLGGAKRMDYLNIIEMSLYPEYFKDIKGFGAGEKWIYVLDKNNKVSRYSYNKNNKQTLLGDNNLGDELFNRSSFYRIYIYNDDLMLFLGDKGDLLTNRPPYRISDKGVSGFEINRDAGSLVYWTKNSIGIVYFEEETGDSLFNETVVIRPLKADMRNLKKCFWVDNNHVLLHDQDKLYLAELQPDGKDHIDMIYSLARDSGVFYSPKSGFCYFLDHKNRQLAGIRIIQKDKTGFEPLAMGKNIR
ncbi:MAG: PEGA domain-containing protein [Candidatus Omnitrophota bacterium]|jgi:hypothetical protein|nr:MAG: PEGA domain-containing protein [Candidatus Omnitrophota bacterium]